MNIIEEPSDICEHCGCRMKVEESKFHKVYGSCDSEPECVVDYVRYWCPNCDTEIEYGDK